MLWRREGGSTRPPPPPLPSAPPPVEDVPAEDMEEAEEGVQSDAVGVSAEEEREDQVVTVEDRVEAIRLLDHEGDEGGGGGGRTAAMSPVRGFWHRTSGRRGKVKNIPLLIVGSLSLAVLLLLLLPDPTESVALRRRPKSNNWANFKLGRLRSLGRGRAGRPKFGQKLTPRLPKLGSIFNRSQRKNRRLDDSEQSERFPPTEPGMVLIDGVDNEERSWTLDEHEYAEDYAEEDYGDYKQESSGDDGKKEEDEAVKEDETKLSFVIRFGGRGNLETARDPEQGGDGDAVASILERPRTLSAEFGDEDTRDAFGEIVRTLLKDGAGGGAPQDVALRINGREFRTKIIKLKNENNNQRIDEGSTEEESSTSTTEEASSSSEEDNPITYNYKIKKGKKKKQEVTYRSKVNLNPGEKKESREEERKKRKKKKKPRRGKAKLLDDSDESASAAVFRTSSSPARLTAATTPGILTPSSIFRHPPPPPPPPPPRLPVVPVPGIPPPLPPRGHPTQAPFYHRTTLRPYLSPDPGYSYSTRPPYYHTTLPPFRHHRPITHAGPVHLTTRPAPAVHGKKIRVIHVSPKPSRPPPDPFVFDFPLSGGERGGSKKSSYVFQSMGHGPSSTSFSYDLDNGRVKSYTGDHIVSPHLEGGRRPPATTPETTPFTARLQQKGKGPNDPQIVRHVPTKAPKFGYTITHRPVTRKSKQLSVNLTPDAIRPQFATPAPNPVFVAPPGTTPPPPLLTQTPFSAETADSDSGSSEAPLKVPPRTKGLPISAPVSTVGIKTAGDRLRLLPETPRSVSSATTSRSLEEEEERSGKTSISVGISRGKLATFETTETAEALAATTTEEEDDSSEPTTTLFATTESLEEEETSASSPTRSPFRSRRPPHAVEIRRRQRRPTTTAPTTTTAEDVTDANHGGFGDRVRRPEQLAILGEDPEDGRNIVKRILDALARNIRHPSKDEVLEELKDELSKEEVKLLGEAALGSLGFRSGNNGNARSQEVEDEEEENRSGGLTFDLFDPFAPFRSEEEFKKRKGDGANLESSDTSGFGKSTSEIGGREEEEEEEEAVTYFPTTEQSAEGGDDAKLFSTEATRQSFKHGRRSHENPRRGGGGRRRGKEEETAGVEGEEANSRLLAIVDDDFSGQLQDLEDFVDVRDGERRVEQLLGGANEDDARRLEDQIHKIYRDQEFVGTTTTAAAAASSEETTMTTEEDNEAATTTNNRAASRFSSSSAQRVRAPTTPETTPRSSFLPSSSAETPPSNRNRARRPLRTRRPTVATTAVAAAATTTETVQQREALRLRAQRIRTRARRPLRRKEEEDSGIETFNGVSVVQIPAHLKKNPESIVVEPIYQEISRGGSLDPDVSVKRSSSEVSDEDDQTLVLLIHEETSVNPISSRTHDITSPEGVPVLSVSPLPITIGERPGSNGVVVAGDTSTAATSTERTRMRTKAPKGRLALISAKRMRAILSKKLNKNKNRRRKLSSLETTAHTTPTSSSGSTRALVDKARRQRTRARTSRLRTTQSIEKRKDRAEPETSTYFPITESSGEQKMLSVPAASTSPFTTPEGTTAASTTTSTTTTTITSADSITPTMPFLLSSSSVTESTLIDTDLSSSEDPALVSLELGGDDASTLMTEFDGPAAAISVSPASLASTSTSEEELDIRSSSSASSSSSTERGALELTSSEEELLNSSEIKKVRELKKKLSRSNAAAAFLKASSEERRKLLESSREVILKKLSESTEERRRKSKKDGDRKKKKKSRFFTSSDERRAKSKLKSSEDFFASLEKSTPTTKVNVVNEDKAAAKEEENLSVISVDDPAEKLRQHLANIERAAKMLLEEREKEASVESSQNSNEDEDTSFAQAEAEFFTAGTPTSAENDNSFVPDPSHESQVWTSISVTTTAAATEPPPPTEFTTLGVASISESDLREIFERSRKQEGKVEEEEEKEEDGPMVIASVTPISRHSFQISPFEDPTGTTTLPPPPPPSALPLLDDQSGLGLGDESLTDDHKTSLLLRA